MQCLAVQCHVLSKQTLAYIVNEKLLPGQKRRVRRLFLKVLSSASIIISALFKDAESLRDLT